MWRLVLQDAQGTQVYKSSPFSEGRWGEVSTLLASMPQHFELLRRPPPCRFAASEHAELVSEWERARACLQATSLSGIVLSAPDRPSRVIWHVYPDIPVLSAPGCAAYLEPMDGKSALRVVVDDPEYAAKLEAWLLRRISHGGPHAVEAPDPDDPQPVESTVSTLALPCMASDLIAKSDSFRYTFTLAGYASCLPKTRIAPLARPALEEYSEIAAAWDGLAQAVKCVASSGEITFSR